MAGRDGRTWPPARGLSLSRPACPVPAGVAARRAVPEGRESTQTPPAVAPTSRNDRPCHASVCQAFACAGSSRVEARSYSSRWDQRPGAGAHGQEDTAWCVSQVALPPRFLRETPEGTAGRTWAPRRLQRCRRPCADSA